MQIHNSREKLTPPQFLKCSHEGKVYSLMFHNADILRLDGTDSKKPADTSFSYEILYCAARKCNVRRGSVTEKLQAGSMTFLKPYSRRRIEAVAGEKLELLSFKFSMIRTCRADDLKVPFCEFLESWAGEELAKINMPVMLEHHARKRYEYLFSSILAQLLPGGNFRWFDLKMSIFQLLAFIVREVYLKNDGECSRDGHIHRVRHAIEEKYAEELHLEDLAELAGKSTTQLCRSFRSNFGTTPIDYQIGIRMEHAKRLLAETELSVKEIAAMVGFNSPYHFSRQFSKRCKTAPSQWRKSIRKPSV